MARVSVLYFAWVRDVIGCDGEALELEDGVGTARDVLQTLATRGGGYAEAFADPSRIRCALDQTMCSLDTEIAQAREIAFFPPVTGG